MPFNEDQPRDEHGQWVAGLSDAERKAITSFTRGNHEAIRRADSGEHTSFEDQQHAAALHAAISRGPAYEGDIHRGLAGLDKRQAKELATVGHELELNAVSSFSTNRGQAKEFAYAKSRKGSEYVVMSVKNNDRGVHIANTSTHSVESEVLVPKGPRYRVTRSERVSRQGVNGYHIDLERIK